MPEHLLAVVAGPGRQVPTRVTGLLLPPDIEITGMQFSHPPDSALWWIQLGVRVASPEGLELLIKRLNRLIDVLRVVTLEPDGHRRQSVYVRLRPAAATWPRSGAGAVVPCRDARTHRRGGGAAPDRRSRPVFRLRVDAPATRGGRGRDERGLRVPYRCACDQPPSVRPRATLIAFPATCQPRRASMTNVADVLKAWPTVMPRRRCACSTLTARSCPAGGTATSRRNGSSASIATWCSRGGSTRRAITCSARESSASGCPAAGRKRPRSAASVRSAPATTFSRRIANRPRPSAVVSGPPSC